MRFDKEQLFGVIIMLVGSYIVSDGIVNSKLSFIMMGFVLYGFAIFLWTATKAYPSQEVPEEVSP